MFLKIKNIIFLLVTVFMLAFSFTDFNLTVNAQTEQDIYIQVANPIDIVNNSSEYLYKKVRLNAVFDKFSTLGLDYKPAMRSSEDYISFLIRRPDVTGSNVIPLSEMKLIISRDKAEKLLIDVESGDKVEFTGLVFSNALNDPWIEVDNVKILNPKKKQTADNSNNKTVKTTGSKK